MPTVSLPTSNIHSLSRIFDLTNKLTIGSAVCFTEGILASIMVLVPQNKWYYITLSLLTLAIWLAFWRFRANKMGADVGDLIFLELVVHVGSAMVYLAGGMTPALGLVYWYIFTSIFALKILRVYLWQGSATQRYGWGRFGFMTRHHARYHAATNTSTPHRRVWVELVLLLGVSILFSAGLHLLSDAGRLVVGWVVPLTFEFLNGPVQLRGMAALQNLFAASTQREADLTEKVKQLEQKLADVGDANHVPDDLVAAVTAALQNAAPAKRAHLVKYLQRAAKLYPAKPDAEK